MCTYKHDEKNYCLMFKINWSKNISNAKEKKLKFLSASARLRKGPLRFGATDTNVNLIVWLPAEISLYTKVYSLDKNCLLLCFLCLCSLLSCNFAASMNATRRTTINWILRLFSCSVWHQNVNWFLFSDFCVNKKRKSCHMRKKSFKLVNWLHCYGGQKGENEMLRFSFKEKTEEDFLHFTVSH